MSHSLIISDLHLAPNTPQLSLFFDFMNTLAPHATSLYILGDFFNYWIGDDDHSNFHQSVIDALKTASDAGLKIYFMHGNRDFLIGDAFAIAAGLTLLKDPSIFTEHGQHIVLTHGDHMCTEDINYQRLRRIIRQRWVQKLFLALPLSWRRNIALEMRKKSKEANQDKQHRPEITDVTEQAVDETFKKHSCTTMIHGHTHRMSTHTHGENTRYVLSDWHENGSYIIINTDKISLKTYSSS